MIFSLHKKEITETIISPITGDKIEFQIRAYCHSCGCVISHSSVKNVEKKMAEFERCKKCGCQEIEVKFTAFETFVNRKEIN